MDWKNLKEMRCPQCGKKIVEVGIGYKCLEEICGFFVGYEKFQKLVKDMTSPKKVLYDPDRVDRSDWE